MSRDIAASVHQRLLNHAKKEGVRFNDVLQRYAMERWLYRLSKSEYRERFILKGALLLIAWDLPVTRPTRDIDMLARVQNDLDGIRQLIGDLCRVECEEDGLIFAAESVTTERIAEDALYEGVRAKFNGSLGNARIAMQIDLGFSDVVTPSPVDLIYPTILDQPAPRLKAYNRETAIAEKLDVMVKLGELNSRMKDYYDLWTLARHFEFDGSVLTDAIKATLERRGRRLQTNQLPGLEDAFAQTPSKQTQWKAFLRRTVPDQQDVELKEVVSTIRAFLSPLLTGISAGEPFEKQWKPKRGWTRGGNSK
ncbi:MAG TPA: nucleotidyl transferase AbiEii/AbiGii toxin family protein [Candidatus Hydrogenedentes bacterium]|nr:nucleotidyl transferase AbiEii/AbiGii toxin family protein [Candidatus Hydrogenedentota bacterium]